MLNEELVVKLRERYNLHPLIFERSLGHAKSDTELFDILDSFPKKFPVIWCDNESKWINLSDPYLVKDFDLV